LPPEQFVAVELVFLGGQEDGLDEDGNRRSDRFSPFQKLSFRCDWPVVVRGWLDGGDGEGKASGRSHTVVKEVFGKRLPGRGVDLIVFPVPRRQEYKVIPRLSLLDTNPASRS
jgi:hypothetical protein